MWVEENIQSSGSSQACFDFSLGSPRSPQHVPYFPNQHKMYGELIWHIYNSVISRSPCHIFGLNLNQDGGLRLANLCSSSLLPALPPSFSYSMLLLLAMLLGFPFCSKSSPATSLFSVTGPSAPPKTPYLSSITPLSLQASQSEAGLRDCLSLKKTTTTTLLSYFRKQSMPKSQEVTVLLKKSSKT